MALLLEGYYSLYQQMAECQKIYDKYTVSQRENKEKSESEYRDLQEYSVNYRVQLENAIKKTETFKNLAKTLCNRSVESQVPLKYDNGRLSQLMVQANSAFNGSIYAEQLYTEASGQMLYLQKEIADIDKKLAEQKVKLEVGSAEENAHDMLYAKEASVRAAQILKEPSARIFFDKLEEDYATYVEGQARENAKINTVSIGVSKMPLPLAGNTVETLGIPEFAYDKIYGGLNIPVDFALCQPMVMGIAYDGLMESILLSGIQNYLINVLRYGGHCFDDILFIDPVRFSNVGLGPLMKISGVEGSVVEKVPTSKDEVAVRVNTLINQLVHQNDDRAWEKGRKLLIFHDFPEGYRSETVAAIRQLCANVGYYGISVIIAYNVSGKSHLVEDAYAEIKPFLTAEIGSVGGKFVFICGQERFPFQWYQAPAVLEQSILDGFISEEVAEDTGNDYLKRIGIPERPVYYKGNRKISNIPYGVGQSGNISFMDFEGSNFASFICGASRSGKTTMLHTLITGVLKSMHPDDVEIWLIDFKMTEFSRYVSHLPPHIRYIILDESPELVYDIVDRLTEILRKRQSIFMGKWQKLDDVPKERYMPVMFIIIDEFSVMSHIIAYAEESGKGDYKVKMQTLLAKGAALGMRFIFSSQGFTSGSRGLNDFAKKQIQQRIAMKTEYQEIVNTLDLNSRSESDKRQMEELDVHYVLVREPMDSNGDHLKLSKVLYISDYTKQEQFIDNINCVMHPSPKYDVTNTESYIDKKPLILDGNRYLAFSEKQAEIEKYILDIGYQNGDSVSYLFLGSPKRLLPVYGIELSNEFGENVLMMTPVVEAEAAGAVVLSAENSFKQQHGETEIWTNRKNGIYRQLHGLNMTASILNDIEEICQMIHQIRKQVEASVGSRRLFILLGFETLLAEMAFVESKMEVRQRRRSRVSFDLLTQMQAGMDPVPEGSLPQESSKDSSQTKEKADIREELKYILTHGPRLGYHFMMVFNTYGEFKQSGISQDMFRHKILFRMAKGDVSLIAGSREAAVVAALEDHCFRYTNGLEGISFKPYLHKGISVDGWHIDENGEVTQSQEEEEYLL